jgi:predicted transcriptional regulator
MQRTTVSLPNELAGALAREARRRNTSVSAITRDALRSHLGFSLDEPRSLPFAAVGRSGERHTAREMERLIEQEWDADDRRR